MAFYKIRHKKTGMFSTGGCNPRWRKSGKTWSRKGDVSSHLTMVGERRTAQVYLDAEVVEYEMVETNIHNPIQWAIGAQERKEEKKAKRRTAWERERKKQEQAELQRLLLKYPQLQLKNNNNDGQETQPEKETT